MTEIHSDTSPSEPQPHPPSSGQASPFLTRVFANQGVLLALLLAALAYAAVVSIWLFVLIVAIVLSVFLHEMGHFLMAKRNGMKVTEFFLGFGPRIWSFRRGETEYGLKLIPAGAYVRIIGMHGREDVVDTDETRTYRSKSFGRRMPVVLAGPVMNLAIGFVLLVIVFAGFGRPSADEWKIRSVVPESAAAQAGLEPGDRIVAFDGLPVAGFENFSSVVRAHAGTTVELTVDRSGDRFVLPTTIGWTLDEGAARALPGLLPGDRVVAVNGTSITYYADLVGAAVRTLGPLDLTLVRNDQLFEARVEGPIALPPDGYRGFLGVGPETIIERSGVVTATGAAASTFGETIVGSVEGIGRIFSPSGLGRLASQVIAGGSQSANPDEGTVRPVSGSGVVSAPSGAPSQDLEDRPLSMIGIFNIGAQIGEETGWAGVLALLATVNIFLGLINLVPLLPFDGGHIAVACYEEIRGRLSRRPYRVDMAKLMPVTYFVVLVMFGLFASTLYLDAVDPVQLNP